MTSVNLIMCKAPYKMLVLWKTLVLNSNRQKKENMSRYLYNTGVAPNSGHKDKPHCEAVKIQIIFRYMGKHLYKDRAVINNNCYKQSQVKCHLKGQLKKKKKNLVQHLKIKNKDSCTHA